MTLFGLRSRRAITTLATLLSVLVGFSPGASASADIKTFTPVAKTRKVLVFKIDGVDPMSIRKASTTLRPRRGKLRKKTLTVRRMRAAAQRGTLNLRRGPSKAKGGKVEVVVEEPTRYAVPPSVPSGCSIDATSEILSWIATVPSNSRLVFRRERLLPHRSSCCEN